jgi:hypothetical protein
MLGSITLIMGSVIRERDFIGSAKGVSGVGADPCRLTRFV